MPARMLFGGFCLANDLVGAQHEFAYDSDWIRRLFFVALK
jgi:hypothetical protein